jgi:hypothetical protein
MAQGLTHEQEIIKWAREEIEKRTGKCPEQLYAEREKRLDDLIELKVPDRIPVFLRFSHFPLRCAGLPESALFYNPGAYYEALVRCIVEFNPDLFEGTSHPTSGLGLEKLGQQQFAWPGGTLREDQADQFHDAEIMKGEEYDLFITDPSDYILRYYMPRAFSALAPLANLPTPLSFVRYDNLTHQAARSITPEVIQAFEALYRAGQEQAKYNETTDRFGNIGELLGLPLITYKGVGASRFGGSVGIPPFDLFANHLRGMRGIMIDMFKRPEKLLEACDRFLEWVLVRAAPADPKKRRARGGSNHFSSEEFLSRKQFEKFVWPTWKKYLLASIDLGYTPRIFMEGKNDSRVELFLELPKGKAFIGFEQADMARAKSILGGHLCIYGGVPSSLLWGGSPHDVEDYCKGLIKDCGKDGGFFICTSSSMNNVRPENVKALVDAVNKYGRYD